MQRLLLSGLLLSLYLLAYPQVVINEFSATNIRGMSDEDGDFCDWIELYNKSGVEINLEGYHLSDDAAILRKWTFPAVSMKPGSFQLVFASDKNRTLPPLSYKTIIEKGEEWRYIVPTSNQGDAWKNTGFDDSGWSTGESGFGYGDNDDATILPNIMSIYVRREFSISSLDDISQFVLSIDYDDGFAAYINGHEIARNNLGTPGTPISYNQAATGREALMFSGGFPENYQVNDPRSLLVEGLNVIAIEGHNTGTGSTDFSLIPMITIGLAGAGYMDDIPDYIQLKGNKLHANFKISSEGETLFLSNPDSSIIDSISPVQMVVDISYGHKPDGSGSLFYFATPTPGTTNVNEGFSFLPRGDTVQFSAKGGYFPGGFNLTLTCADPADTIFYTLDGSEPSRDDLVYSGPVAISTNTVVRAVSLNWHKLPGVIATNTYVTVKHTLPVICISTDPENLWDYYTGIYVMGPNASTTNPYHGANFWQDWEKEAHMEFYDENNARQLNQDIGIKIFGAWSRAHPQKSLALFARREYGKGSFDYKFFKDKPITKFESIILRNGGNDWDYAIFRDGLTSTLVRDMDIDRMAFQPAILYLNGEYWGILNIREKINPNFLAENHFVDPENVNLLEDNAQIVDGTNESYLQLTDFISSNNLADEQNYSHVSSRIDVNNFIQYQLTEIYIDNQDWPGNNIKFWNTNDPGSLWRWILFDTDFGFSIYHKNAYEYNTLEFALDPDEPDWPNPSWATLILRKMLANPGFRNNFVNQYCDRINTTFKADRIVSVTDSIKQIYMPEINRHIDRWELNYSYFISSINNITNFAINRPAYARLHLKSVLGLGDMLTLRLEVRNPGSGRIKINTVIPGSFPFTGNYFKGVPVRLTAIPAPGFRFVRWENGSFILPEQTIDYNMTGSAIFTAVFEAAENTDNRLVINEINYNSSPQKETGDWVEIYNSGNTTVDLKDWTISDSGIESGFKIPSSLVLAPRAFAVICRDTKDFLKYYPKVKNTTGDMDFGLSSTGDDINLFDPDGNLIDFVNYSVNLPWPTDASGTGATIELTDPFCDNNLGQNWRSNHTGGSPGEKNIITGMNEVNDLSSGLNILSCFPNPFRDFTSIYFEVIIPGRYQIRVFDLQGRLLKVIADKVYETGSYTIDWDGNDSEGVSVKGGVYMIRMSGKTVNHNLKVIHLD